MGKYSTTTTWYPWMLLSLLLLLPFLTTTHHSVINHVIALADSSSSSELSSLSITLPLIFVPVIIISHVLVFSRYLTISHSRPARPTISYRETRFVSGTRWPGDFEPDGSSIYMGCPPVLSSLFDSISFRAFDYSLTRPRLYLVI